MKALFRIKKMCSLKVAWKMVFFVILLSLFTIQQAMELEMLSSFANS